MKYQGFMPNDFVNGKNVSVSLWTSGCPHHCPGCHNPEAWDRDSGYDVPVDIEEKIVKSIGRNGIVRNFSILGGEPLAPYNCHMVANVLRAVRAAYPNIQVYVWTGYTLDTLLGWDMEDINYILDNIDVLIDGPYKQELRDVSLELRGSTNQRILKKGVDF